MSYEHDDLTNDVELNAYSDVEEDSGINGETDPDSAFDSEDEHTYEQELSEDQEFKEQVKKNVNPRNDASSIYMKEIGGPELKDIAGEIETSQRIEKHKNSFLFYLMLFPSINALVVKNYMEEKERECGHPKVQPYGNSGETDAFCDAITNAFISAGSLYKDGINSPLTLNSTDFAGIAKTFKLLEPNNVYKDVKPSKNAINGRMIAEPDYDFFTYERFVSVLKDGLISKKALSTVKKLFPIFGFNVDYSYVKKIHSEFAATSRQIFEIENKLTEVFFGELKYKKSELLELYSKSKKVSFGLGVSKLSDSQYRRVNYLRLELNKHLEVLGVNYKFYRDAVVKIGFHKKKADNFISEMVVCNLRLVIKDAKGYNNPYIEFNDFVQEGNLGLLRAVEKYDYRRGHKFSTYSTWWIKQGITRAIHEQGGIVRIPVHMAEFYKKIDRYMKGVAARGGKVPSPVEIAEALGEKNVAKVELALSYGKELISLETPMGSEDDEGASLGQFFTYEDDSVIHTPTQAKDHDELKRILFECVNRLPERDANIIIMRSGMNSGVDKTLEETGRQFNVTRERIRQLEYKAFGRMKEILINEYGFDEKLGHK